VFAKQQLQEGVKVFSPHHKENRHIVVSFLFSEEMKLTLQTGGQQVGYFVLSVCNENNLPIV